MLAVAKVAREKEYHATENGRNRPNSGEGAETCLLALKNGNSTGLKHVKNLTIRNLGSQDFKRIDFEISYTALWQPLSWICEWTAFIWNGYSRFA